MAAPHPLALFCKSYRADLDHCAQLVESIRRHNRDRLPCDLSVPASDRFAFLQALGQDGIELVTDEEVIGGSIAQGWTSQQLVPETGRNVAAECEGIVGAPMAGHVSWRINGQVKCGSLLYAGYVYEAPRAAFTLELDTPDGNDSLFLAVRSWTSMVLAGTHRCQAADADIGMAEVVFDVRSDALAIASDDRRLHRDARSPRHRRRRDRQRNIFGDGAHGHRDPAQRFSGDLRHTDRVLGARTSDRSRPHDRTARQPLPR